MKKGLILLIILLVACGGEVETATSSLPVSTEEMTPRTLTMMTHDSFAISESVIVAFEEEHHAKIILLPSGDTGAALNQAILSADNPLADIFYGVDNSFMSRAIGSGIFEPYASPQLAQIDDSLKLDSSNQLLPVDYGDVCLNYDIGWFAENNLQPPQSLVDLTDEAYAELLVVQNPATSSPGLAFMLATIAEFGTDGDYTYLDYWAELRANGVLVTNGWEDAYFGQFTVASDGERPLIVSYASSPPAEVIFADPPIDEAPSASVIASGTCFRQVEFVGILKGTQERELAELFVDFMLSQTFQEDIPLNMFVFPANETAVLPEAFTQWAQIPTEPASVDAAEIDANRETWIEEWTEVTLR